MNNDRLKEVLAIVNDKGGVGKSTTAHNLACGILQAHPEWRVLIIDLDAQVANVSLLCGWRKRTDKHGTMYEALTGKAPMQVYQVRAGEQDYGGNLYLAPSSEALLDVDDALKTNDIPQRVLFDVFTRHVTLSDEQGGEQRIVEAFDYIIIDCPPSMGLVTRNALCVATGIIIPIQLEALPTFGSSSVIKWAQEMKAKYNKNLTLRGIVKVMCDRRTKVGAGFSKHLDDEYGKYMFHTEIPRRTKIQEAQAMLLDIFSYAPDCDAAKAYAELAREVIGTAG